MKCFAKIIWLLPVLVFTSCSPRKELTWGSSFHWRQLFNIHESPRRWLSVYGERYYYPRGIPPYHLNVPEINGVFFVTEDRPGTDFKCHFYLLKERRDVVFQMQSGYLGGGIAQPKEGIFSDWIAAVDGPVIVVVSKAEAKLTTYRFNLQDNTVEASPHESNNSNPTEAAGSIRQDR